MHLKHNDSFSNANMMELPVFESHEYPDGQDTLAQRLLAGGGVGLFVLTFRNGTHLPKNDTFFCRSCNLKPVLESHCVFTAHCTPAHKFDGSKFRNATH